MIELIAPNGYVYRFKTDPNIYGKQIILGINDSEDNWELIEEVINKDEILNETV